VRGPNGKVFVTCFHYDVVERKGRRVTFEIQRAAGSLRVDVDAARVMLAQDVTSWTAADRVPVDVRGHGHAMYRLLA